MGWDAFLQTPVQKIMKNDILGQEGLRISQTLYYNYWNIENKKSYIYKK